MSFLLFLLAASLIALSPGPGIFYVAARTLAGGRAEGLASSVGTGIGGLAHVLAGAVGVSALVMASAEAFTLLKIAGALYLVWLGLKTIRRSGDSPQPATVARSGAARAFREGIVVEALNPKTAAFFLAFLPQFVDPAAGAVWLQFVALGTISVLLNTAVDFGVVFLAARARTLATSRPSLLRRLRQGSGVAIATLGVALLLARKPVTT